MIEPIDVSKSSELTWSSKKSRQMGRVEVTHPTHIKQFRILSLLALIALLGAFAKTKESLERKQGKS